MSLKDIEKRYYIDGSYWYLDISNGAEYHKTILENVFICNHPIEKNRLRGVLIP